MAAAAVASPQRRAPGVENNLNAFNSPPVKRQVQFRSPGSLAKVKWISPRRRSPFVDNPVKAEGAGVDTTTNTRRSLLESRVISKIRDLADMLFEFKNGYLSQKMLSKRLIKKARLEKTLHRLDGLNKYAYPTMLSPTQLEKVSKYLHIAKTCLERGWFRENVESIDKRALPSNDREFLKI